MAYNRGIQRKWIIAIFGFFLTGCLLSGCLPARKKPESAAYPPDKISAMEKDNQALRRALAASNETAQSQEGQISSLKIQILEYEALVNDLRRRSEFQQKRLDDAIIEVVRAKAKLRSLESKAEAASTLAEAEIAVKALRSRATSADEVTLKEISTADQLLNMSVKEFNAQNYGGALYLANQTKGQVRAVQIRLDKGSEGAAVEGESPFAQPLRLKVLKNSNLREGPGLEQKIVGRLDEGVMVVGYAFKGGWIRVETQDGVTGWIFQALIGAP